MTRITIKCITSIGNILCLTDFVRELDNRTLESIVHLGVGFNEGSLWVSVLPQFTFLTVLLAGSLTSEYIHCVCMCAGDIGEYGCLRSHHCTGGAVCYQRRCVCPDGYIQTASGTKCVKRGGTVCKP